MAQRDFTDFDRPTKRRLFNLKDGSAFCAIAGTDDDRFCADLETKGYLTCHDSYGFVHYYSFTRRGERAFGI